MIQGSLRTDRFRMRPTAIRHALHSRGRREAMEKPRSDWVQDYTTLASLAWSSRVRVTRMASSRATSSSRTSCVPEPDSAVARYFLELCRQPDSTRSILASRCSSVISRILEQYNTVPALSERSIRIRPFSSPTITRNQRG